MNARKLLLNSTFVLSGVMFGLTASLVGCSHHPKPQPEAAPPTPPKQLSASEMEQVFAQAMTPNANHKVLEPLVGKWNTETKFWMGPNTAPESSHGKAENRWVYGGRFVEGHYKGKWNGQPFEGTGVWGYDNVAKQYQSSWHDSMSTQLMLSSGNYDPSKNALSLSGTVSCPMVGGPKNVRSVTTILDKNRHTFEMFDKAPDGTEYKTLEIIYTRVPNKAKASASAETTPNNAPTKQKS